MDAEAELRRRDEIVQAILQSYADRGEMSHLEGGDLPSRESLWLIVEDLLRLVFPGFLELHAPPHAEIAHRTGERVSSIERRLAAEIRKGFRISGCPDGSAQVDPTDDACAACVPPPEERDATAWAAARRLLSEIPRLRDMLSFDIEAAYEGDPATRSFEEVIVSHPGLQAIAVQRMAHVLYEERIPMVPRVMTEFAHSQTGIDIHPGATIGKRFFIDHGTGVVIGETAVIGDRVRIYQGVTLGARSFQKDEEGRLVKGIKRHPDIEDDVTIYSGASVLGDVRIGRGSVVGGNVWLTHGVPPYTKIMVTPPQQIHLDESVDDYQI